MQDMTSASPRTFSVRADYMSDGETFAVETFTVTACDPVAAMAIARDQVTDSIYHDSRVPDLTTSIIVEEWAPDDPDSPPPVSGAAVKPVCPRCGSDDIVKDACARWDEHNRCWSLAGTYDCETCQECGAEGNEIAKWLPDPTIPASDRFLWAVLELLQRRDLALDAGFQEFCLNVHDQLTVDQAVEAWCARSAPAG